MYIATNEDFCIKHNILSVLPVSIKRYMCGVNLDEAEEIRLIQGKEMFIRYPDGDYFITTKGVLSKSAQYALKVSKKHLDELLERITKSSLYTVKDELKNGYITIDGGHRVGICASAVTENGSVEFMKNISAMNIRIANEITGAADSVIEYVSGDEVKNTLILSPPSCGKTTLLRDLVRRLSYSGYSVGVADERCEIAAMYGGESAFDLGPRTMVMDNCPKEIAMTMLLRSMSPDIIVTDELGKDADVKAVIDIVNSGVKVIATVHGRDIKQLAQKNATKLLLPMFDLIIILSRRNGAGTVEKIVRTKSDA